MTSVLPQLPDVDEVRPVDETDAACFDEIRQVLGKHGALSRFGLTLLHQHFEIADGEVLVERVNLGARTLTTRPRASTATGSSVETSWRLDDPNSQRRCETICQPERDFEGHPYHNRPHFAVT